MKIIITILNIVVVGIISTLLVVYTQKPVEVNKLLVTAEVKTLQTEALVVEIEAETQGQAEEKEEEVDVPIVDGKSQTVAKKKEVEVVEVSKDVVSTPPVVSDVLESHVGRMSGYGPDCAGCSGYLASGKYVGNGTIYYSDSKYGQVRILAGDRTYPFGTIVRVKNSKVSSQFLGIVLDRGGMIGFGKKFLFDLLYSSEKEALRDEVSYQTTFEVLRYGY